MNNPNLAERADLTTKMASESCCRQKVDVTASASCHDLLSHYYYIMKSSSTIMYNHMQSYANVPEFFTECTYLRSTTQIHSDCSRMSLWQKLMIGNRRMESNSDNLKEKRCFVMKCSPFYLPVVLCIFDMSLTHWQIIDTRVATTNWSSRDPSSVLRPTQLVGSL